MAITDEDRLYWTTNWDHATKVQRTRLFHMPKAGGEIVELTFEPDPIDLDVDRLARDEDGLVLIGHGRRDDAGGPKSFGIAFRFQATPRGRRRG